MLTGGGKELTDYTNNTFWFHINESYWTMTPYNYVSNCSNPAGVFYVDQEGYIFSNCYACDRGVSES